MAAPPSHTASHVRLGHYCPLLLCRRDGDAPPLTISYTLPVMTLSGVYVRFLRIAMRDADAAPGAKGPAPTKWVRYRTEAGEHHHRLRAEGQPAPPPMPEPPLREPWKPPPPPPSAVVATATPAATVAAAPAATPTFSRLEMDTAKSAEEREEAEKEAPPPQQQQHGTAATTARLAQLKELNSSLQTEHAELRRRVEAAESQDTAAEANRALQAENDALRKRLAALESGSGTALQDENAELQRRLATLEAASAAASPSSSAVIAATAHVVLDVV